MCGLLGFIRDEQSQADMLRNLQHLLQASSNSVASNVTHPVDLIASGLGRAGLHVPQPIGGSEWARSVGLLADVPPGPPQIAGETLGLLSMPLMGLKSMKGVK